MLQYLIKMKLLVFMGIPMLKRIKLVPKVFLNYKKMEIF